MKPEADSSNLSHKELLLGRVGMLVSRSITGGSDYRAILDDVFAILDSSIPFDRIGIATCEHDKKDVVLTWVKSKLGVKHLNLGYSSPLVGSSLAELAKNRHPRIIDDLELYAEQHSKSRSTGEAIKDGIRSSLTFPLLIEDEVVGFVFFSSAAKGTYNATHIEMFSIVAEELAMLVRYGQLSHSFANKKASEQMIRTTIHELRSPLAIIQGYLNLLSDERQITSLGDSEKELFNILRRNVQGMIRLVADIAEADAYNAPTFSLHLQPICVQEFLSEIANQCLILVHEKGCHLQMFFSDGLAETIVADPLRIQQVINNLVTNSVKFSKPGTTVSLECSSGPGAIVFSVADNGPGIPAAEIKLLFQDFGKTSVKPTAGESSSGLGLAICRRIVEAHGGKIKASSREGSGSIFTFWLPTGGSDVGTNTVQ